MQCFALNWLFRIILFFSFFSFHSLHPFGHCLLLSLWKYLFFFLTLCSWYGSRPGATCLPIILVQNILIGALSNFSYFVILCIVFRLLVWKHLFPFVQLSPLLDPQRQNKRQSALDQHPFSFLISLFHAFCSFPISYLKYLVSSFSKLPSYMNEGCFHDCHLWLWIWTVLF